MNGRVGVIAFLFLLPPLLPVVLCVTLPVARPVFPPCPPSRFLVFRDVTYIHFYIPRRFDTSKSVRHISCFMRDVFKMCTGWCVTGGVDFDVLFC